jgi:hypothetical protein
MRIWKINAALYFVCVIAVVAVSQDSPPRIITAGPPVSLAEQLKQHHVELTRAGLLKALRSSDEQVKYLAALRLAEEKEMDAIPAIEETPGSRESTDSNRMRSNWSTAINSVQTFRSRSPAPSTPARPHSRDITKW